MKSDPTVVENLPRPVGRPPRISREAVLEAAAEVGIENLTMRSVADRLGVKVSSLYHYVSGKDDLLRLAAEHTAQSIRVPADEGQHWAVWLFEWAVHVREAFIAEPGLMRQFIDGMAAADRAADTIDAVIGTLMRNGFEIDDARRMHNLIGAFTIGAVAGEIRDRQAEAAGEPLGVVLAEVLKQRPRNELPYARALFAGRGKRSFDPDDEFEANLTTVLRGVAAERRARWEPIARGLDQLKATRR